MKAFPTLQSDRLLLNQLQLTDIPAIVNYADHPDIAATTATIPHPYHEKDAIHWLDIAYQGFAKEAHYVFAVRQREQQNFIGGIGLHLNKVHQRASLGYWIAVPFWNQGYATEATGLILKFGFEQLKLNKIHADHLLENPSSGKVMAKNGMRKEGVLEEHLNKNGVLKTIVSYGLTAKQFRQL